MAGRATGEGAKGAVGIGTRPCREGAMGVTSAATQSPELGRQADRDFRGLSGLLYSVFAAEGQREGPGSSAVRKGWGHQR